MLEENWVPLSVSPATEHWVTRKSIRTVLAVAHTVVSTQRLLDVVTMLEQDARIQVVFTCAPDVFGGVVPDYLHRLGVLRIPWAQAVRKRFDLALAAAYGGLERLRAPIMVLPHGAGYAKRTPSRAGSTEWTSVYGLGAEHLMHAGRPVPDCIVLSHKAQLNVLALECPEAVDFAVVAGDPCYDRMVASAGRRTEYRAALDLCPGQRLLTVASTWGPHSLFARRPELLRHLQNELHPAGYRIAALLHPAAWSAHGRRQVRAWLRAELDAGLVLPAPEDDWRAVVLGSDHIVGDHGSTTVYAAAAGVPVLLTDLPIGQLEESSAQSYLARVATRLRAGLPVEQQLAAAELTSGHVLRTKLTSCPGEAHDRLRAEMYRLLRLSVPRAPVVVDPIPPLRLGSEDGR